MRVEHELGDVLAGNAERPHEPGLESHAQRRRREEGEVALLPAPRAGVRGVALVYRVVEPGHASPAVAGSIPAVDRVVDVPEPNPCQVETGLDRADGKDAGRVLEADQPLLLGVRYDLAVYHEGRGGVDAVEVAEDPHGPPGCNGE